MAARVPSATQNLLVKVGSFICLVEQLKKTANDTIRIQCFRALIDYY